MAIFICVSSDLLLWLKRKHAAEKKYIKNGVQLDLCLHLDFLGRSWKNSESSKSDRDKCFKYQNDKAEAKVFLAS